jgi:Ion channel
MTTIGGVRLDDLQKEYSDRLLSVLTVLLLIMLFVVAPFHAAGIRMFEAFGAIVALVMVAGVLVISASPTATLVILAGFLLNVFVVIARLIRPTTYDLYLVAAAWFVIVCTLAVVVARTVFAQGRVSFHRVVGAVLLYLLIALAFVSLFMLVGLLVPNAFSGLVFEDNEKLASNLIYFSFVTLTSTGYGDIYPVHPIARSLCNLETIIGQLYPATLLARLVSLEIAGRSR